MYVKHYCDYFYHKLSIWLHYIQFLMNAYVWDKRNNDQCFSSGPDLFCPTSKKETKRGQKGVGVAQYWFGQIFKTQEKGWKFIECSLYIYILNKT